MTLSTDKHKQHYEKVGMILIILNLKHKISIITAR